MNVELIPTVTMYNSSGEGCVVAEADAPTFAKSHGWTLTPPEKKQESDPPPPPPKTGEDEGTPGTPPKKTPKGK